MSVTVRQFLALIGSCVPNGKTGNWGDVLNREEIFGMVDSPHRVMRCFAVASPSAAARKVAGEWKLSLRALRLSEMALWRAGD